ncbi:MAG TPA: glycolate oxidase subunit GlcE [Sedimenticola thiotaurini]|uniref:Glycolate oxidase subunit GlcE n=1 Tax=Sedimenticola thiotaurini TaxID=1543721 RepID=A0A831RMY0_9GAMM|nr:glycolate oxidase subunit GlcE [Sedimenticola thiotaurini]
MSDLTTTLQQQVAAAYRAGTPLQLVGGGSKDFYGRTPRGEPLPLAGHSGVVNYEPRELVLTARAGTTLAEIEALLRRSGQMLPFEPPHFGDAATLGGTLACGLSGPRRPYVGALRDFVLGVRLINGRGELLHFGGEVMKNVAGYDVSRLMAGALGTLGVVLEVSLKVLPRPENGLTLVQERTPEEAILVMNQWAAAPLPLTAACYDGLRLYVRLEGAPATLTAGRQRVGGDLLEEGERFWRDLREQRLAFFETGKPLWRLSVPATAPPVELAGKQLIDWGGAQRWLVSDAPAAAIREASIRVGGAATLFRGGDREGEVFQPLPAPMAALQRSLKQAFDPAGILNPGRMYREF